jgi:hypothetical protein
LGKEEAEGSIRMKVDVKIFLKDKRFFVYEGAEGCGYDGPLIWVKDSDGVNHCYPLVDVEKYEWREVITAYENPTKSKEIG